MRSPRLLTHISNIAALKESLQSILRETGPLPSDEDRKARKSEGGAAVGSSKKKGRQYDIEKLADAIQALSEDDLLHVIQLVHDYKNEDTYITHNMDGKRGRCFLCLYCSWGYAKCDV